MLLLSQGIHTRLGFNSLAITTTIILIIAIAVTTTTSLASYMPIPKPYAYKVVANSIYAPSHKYASSNK